MDKILLSVKRLCEYYIGNANSGLKQLPDGWWSGYYTGQKKMAESIIEFINKEQSDNQ